MTRAAATLLLLATLCGCATTDDPWLAQNGGQGAPAGRVSNSLGSAQTALARIPALGETPIAVRNLSADGAAVQQIVYRNKTAGSGENMLTIARMTGSGRHASLAPTHTQLTAEMREALPGIDMASEPAFRQNAYGAYGVATGAVRGGGACLYAWQRIDTWPGTREPATVRLRYCDPKGDKVRLASLLDSLTLGADGSVLPLVSARPAPTDAATVTSRRAGPRMTQSAHTLATGDRKPSPARSDEAAASVTPIPLPGASQG